MQEKEEGREEEEEVKEIRKKSNHHNNHNKSNPLKRSLVRINSDGEGRGINLCIHSGGIGNTNFYVSDEIQDAILYKRDVVDEEIGKEKMDLDQDEQMVISMVEERITMLCNQQNKHYWVLKRQDSPIGTYCHHCHMSLFDFVQTERRRKEEEEEE